MLYYSSDNFHQIISFILHIFTLEYCDPGTFRNPQTLTCDDCGIGFYQNLSNQLFCYPCPPGLTTITTTATQGDQCSGKAHVINYMLHKLVKV